MPAALRSSQVACSDCSLRDARDIGSNNFAVAAAHGAQVQARGEVPHAGPRRAPVLHEFLPRVGRWF
mgnify:CR=1 FL=1